MQTTSPIPVQLNVQAEVSGMHWGFVVVVIMVVVDVVLVGVVTQTLPVQSSPVGQSPQLSVSGQVPSMTMPHCAPSAVQDEGVQHTPLGRVSGG